MGQRGHVGSVWNTHVGARSFTAVYELLRRPFCHYSQISFVAKARPAYSSFT